MSAALHRYQITTTIATVGASADVHAIRITTPSTRRCRINELEISTAGTDGAANPVRVRIVRALTSGLSSGTGSTPVPVDPAMPASLCTGTTQMTVGSLSGGAVVGFDNRVANAATLVVIPLPEDSQPVAAVSSTFDVFVTGGGTAASNVTVTVTWDE